MGKNAKALAITGAMVLTTVAGVAYPPIGGMIVLGAIATFVFLMVREMLD